MDNLVSAAGGVCAVSALICVLRMIAGGAQSSRLRQSSS